MNWHTFANFRDVSPLKEGGFSIHCHSADEEGVPAPSKPLMAQGQNNRRLAR